MRSRVIPVLLLKKGGLYKSVKFKDHKYIGDPINAVRIFNEKEVDEIVILDIEATAQGRPPDLKRISEIASEAFMPLSYGGGITSVDQVKQILYEGVEKVIFNTSAILNPKLIEETARLFGSSSVIVSIDVKSNWLGKPMVFIRNGRKSAGAGEVFLNSIDRDGTYTGYDISLVSTLSSQLNVPLIICGGASSIADFKQALDAGASAVGAGSMFVFQRPHNAVLISYPQPDALKKAVFQK
jgi:cyclase